MKQPKKSGTRVKFYLDKDGEVLAYFPDMEGDSKGNKTCYAHIGQHSACSPDYVKGLKKAAPGEYIPLLKELIGQGYNDLQVIDGRKITLLRTPTKQEIKFGYGGIHYREFKITELGYNEKGDLKKWLKAPDDGLRYYR
jgi:hypothetical protein